MNTELAQRPTSALAVSSAQTFWTEEQIAALRQIGVENAPSGDLAVFLNYAQRTGLDPFARQLYMIGRNTKDNRGNWVTKWTIQASIDGLRIVAERSGDYAGQTEVEYCGEDGVWRSTWTAKTPPVAARVGVLRHHFSQPLYAVAYYDEYVQTTKDGHPTSMWASKPRVMLAKCAEALALRKAFPNDLSGIYTADEMGSADARQAIHAPQPANVDVETGEIVEGEIVDVLVKAMGARELQARLGDEFEVIENGNLEQPAKWEGKYPAGGVKGSEPATERQVKAVFAIGHQLSLHTTGALVDALSGFLGRPIRSVDELFKGEVDRILRDKGDALLAHINGKATEDDPWAAPAPPANTDAVTPAEIAKLEASFLKAGITDRVEKLDYCIAVVNRPLGSARDLTKSEASAIITQLTI